MAKRKDLEFRRDLARFVGPGPDLLKVERLYDRLIVATSDLERGKWLIEIRAVLERSGNFGRFLHAMPLFALRSAYRYINGFETCQRLLPPAVLQEAMEMDLPIYGDEAAPFGRYTDAIKATPPPKNPSPKTARKWLEGIVAATPRYHRIINPDQASYLLFRAFANRTGGLELPPRERKAFLAKLVGMMLAHWDIESTTFTPVTIPEFFKLGYEAQKARWARAEVAGRRWYAKHRSFGPPRS